MEVVIVGYFNRFDKFNNFRLVNLESESMEKLRNCGKTLYPSMESSEYKSPVLPNGAIIKHDTRVLCYDVDGVPTSTGKLMGQKVQARVKVRKYKWVNADGEKMVGWSMKLLRLSPA